MADEPSRRHHRAGVAALKALSQAHLLMRRLMSHIRFRLVLSRRFRVASLVLARKSGRWQISCLHLLRNQPGLATMVQLQSRLTTTNKSIMRIDAKSPLSTTRSRRFMIITSQPPTSTHLRREDNK